MAQNEINLLNYIVVCIAEFAEHHNMSSRVSYIYLSKNKGIDFLKEFYDVEHTLSFDDVIADLTLICKKKRRSHMLKLYHGSDIKIDSVDLAKCFMIHLRLNGLHL